MKPTAKKTASEFAQRFLPSPEEFSGVLGQVVWLMSLSKEHKQLPISSIDSKVLPSIVFKQFKLLTKNKRPVAFIAWARVSDEVLERFDRDGTLEFGEWQSGTNLVVVECIVPFGSAKVLKDEFIEKFKFSKSEEIQ